jgi:4-hydroxybenzoyl-CoA thioesterase
MANAIYRHTVEWGDCDPAAIVFYPNFYRWMDASTWALFAAHGLDPATVEARYGVFGTPLVETGAKYLAPVKAGDTIEIESRVESWSRKTFRVAHLIRRGDTLCAEGYEVRVWGMRDDAGTIRAGVIPDEVKALMG